ncbi:MAG: sialidase family protein, partial [Candidatus Scatosoma sp.]
SDRFGFYAWPTIAVLKDGTLAMACSGRRTRHIDPFGAVTICYSKDGGRHWSAPAVALDTPLDDRDGGLCVLSDGTTLLTTFNNTVDFQRKCAALPDRTAAQSQLYNAYLDMLTEEDERKNLGSLISVSPDGYSFEKPYKIPVSAPHGPVLLPNGKALYVGRPQEKLKSGNPLAVYQSSDGKKWEKTAEIETDLPTAEYEFCEPHAVGLPNGKIVALIRVQGNFFNNSGRDMRLFQCESVDGGFTFTKAKDTGVEGGPPFLTKHSSGTVICSYGYRKQPYGQKVMFSDDGCNSWDTGYVINGKAAFFDLGYPSTAELPDGSLITVYYQTEKEEGLNGIYYTVWKFKKV